MEWESCFRTIWSIKLKIFHFLGIVQWVNLACTIFLNVNIGEFIEAPAKWIISFKIIYCWNVNCSGYILSLTTYILFKFGILQVHFTMSTSISFNPHCSNWFDTFFHIFVFSLIWSISKFTNDLISLINSWLLGFVFIGC